MDQEHRDYADPEPHRHPWTVLEIVILLLAIGVLVPVLGAIVVQLAVASNGRG